MNSKQMVMKKIIISIAVILSLSAMTLNAQQNLRTGYFMDGYTYAYKMNPAFQGERGFLAIPVLGKTSLGIESNLSLSTFLYPTSDGKLATFLHPDVSADEFLGNMKYGNKVIANVDLPVIAFGFRTGKAYHTLDLSLRVDAGANLSKDLFRFMKVGSSDGTTSWNISDLGVRAEARAELAYGYSRKFGENVTAGARVKMLVGLARADVDMENMNFKLSGEEWAVNAKGAASLAGPIRISTMGETGTASDPSQNNYLDWGSIGIPPVEELISYIKSPSSLGFAVDFGVSVDFLKYLTVSASINDLGFISWKDMMRASTPETEWSFRGFENLSLDDGSAVEEQFGEIADEFLNAVNVSRDGIDDKASCSLSATAHVGIEARVPFYERLTFGLLGTHRFAGAYSWTEGRLSANLALLRGFAISGSYAFSTFGSSLGAAMNLHFSGVTLFAGLDSFSPLLEVTPAYYIPVKSWNTNVNFGLNIAFGKYNGPYPKKKKVRD